ncbi:MAG TPA: MBL fold metallo-hydrolase [Candidatus Dormibacteraeota bacterium]|nr:MBL fold metallo-hydrolase [Candidatus Dormibacteraeota bacterium]
MTEPAVILAPNPSMLTGPGTNTYLTGGGGSLLCVDPGPDDRAHLEAILRAADDRRSRITTIVLSHSHPDHRPLARGLAARCGATVRCLDPGRGDDGALAMVDGERVSAGDATLEAVATPGHAADHLCFLDLDTRALYSGDHILSGMTAVVAPPDGDMTDYVRSLERVRRLRPSVIHPGHGPRVDDADALIAEYLSHRRDREAQVERALREREGFVSPIDVVPEIYAGHPQALWPFAAMSVQAHLDKLVREGRAERSGSAAAPVYRAPAGGGDSGGPGSATMHPRTGT